VAQTENIHVGCLLDDGSYVEGELGSFSVVGDDVPDRDLVLTEPVSYRPPGADEVEPYGCSAVCLSAARIVAAFVTYVGPAATSSPEAAGEEGLGAGLAAELSASGPS
jgi:hypothetical protein